MENRAISCDREQSESRTISPPTVKMTVGNVAETAISKRRVDAHHIFAHQAAVSALAILLVAAPLCAQKGAPPSSPGGSHGPSGGTPPSGRSVYGSDSTLQDGMKPSTLSPIAALEPLPRPQVIEDETCLPWTVSAVRGATVSVMRLQVPSKARSEFEKACGDMKKRKLSDAEHHARNAIEKYPNYVAAWVMLGKVLEGLQQTQEARDACSHALSTDPTYLPPYLCLAEISVRDQQWDEVLNLTDHAVGLNRAGDAYAYFFRATAYYHMHRIAEAEKSALEAAGIGREQNEPPVSFLLAQIYEAEGNSDVAAAQIRQFLKLSTDRRESIVAKEYLAKLEAQQATK